MRQRAQVVSSLLNFVRIRFDDVPVEFKYHSNSPGLSAARHTHAHAPKDTSIKRKHEQHDMDNDKRSESSASNVDRANGKNDESCSMPVFHAEHLHHSHCT